MPFKTILNKDVLNIIFDYCGITAEYNYYKNVKKSMTGFRNLKLKYKCCKCKKNLRNINTSVFGFIINFYDYYIVDNKKYFNSESRLSKFRHQKRYNAITGIYGIGDINFQNVLNNLLGNITESLYHYNILISNHRDGKILGRLIIKRLKNISSGLTRLNREKNRLEKYGINMNVEYIEKDLIIKNLIINIKKRISVLNNNIMVGYYCKPCSKDESYYNFMKL